MLWTLSREMRPVEKVPISVDCTADVPAGDTMLSLAATAAYEDAPSVDVSGTCLTASGLVGNVGGVTVISLTANRVLVVAFTFTTSAGYVFQHAVRVPCAANA